MCLKFILIICFCLYIEIIECLESWKEFKTYKLDELKAVFRLFDKEKQSMGVDEGQYIQHTCNFRYQMLI